MIDKTLLNKIKEGDIPKLLEESSKLEGVSVDYLAEGVESGRIVIPYNNTHWSEGREVRPVAIGEGLTIKVNANIGTSRDLCDVDMELRKVNIAIKSGTDTVMDLSTGGDIREIRREVRSVCKVPLGTVPVYELFVKYILEERSMKELSPDEIFETIEKHGEDGVDFITVHCGVTRETIKNIKERTLGVVSRGGSFLMKWMRENKEDNPLYTEYDRLLEIAGKYDMTLSLGDGLRPGAIADATDIPQIAELSVLGELAKRAQRAGVQVMIEGPGHVPLQDVKMNIEIQKKLCDGAPFYVLGPLVTDIAPGYDHIVSAIGGAIAGWSGADFLCYVTPAEHLALPNEEDVREGVISSKIAAHAADIARGIEGADDWDREMSEARSRFDWNTQRDLALDPEIVNKVRERCQLEDEEVCSMCAKLCAIKISRDKKSQ